MSNKFYKTFQNICSIIIIAVCILSLIRIKIGIGYSIFPILMIILQIIVLILNNKKDGNIRIHKR